MKYKQLSNGKALKHAVSATIENQMKVRSAQCPVSVANDKKKLKIFGIKFTLIQ